MPSMINSIFITALRDIAMTGLIFQAWTWRLRLTNLVRITWCLQSGSRILSRSSTSSTHVCNHYDKCFFINVGFLFPYHLKTIHFLSSWQGCLALPVMIGFCLYHYIKISRPPGLGASSPSQVCS